MLETHKKFKEGVSSRHPKSPQSCHNLPFALATKFVAQFTTLLPKLEADPSHGRCTFKKMGPKIKFMLFSNKNNPFRPFQRNFCLLTLILRDMYSPYGEERIPVDWQGLCQNHTGQFTFPKHKQQLDKAGDLTEASLSLGGGGHCGL